MLGKMHRQYVVPSSLYEALPHTNWRHYMEIINRMRKFCTCENMPVPLINEVRIGHTNVMTKENHFADGILKLEKNYEYQE